MPSIIKSVLLKFLGVLAELFKRIKENVKRSDFREKRWENGSIKK